ncbi:MAG TPA: TAXI family TRAP transporter solute-binding subunit, partial [Bacillota bacterium]
NVVETGATLDNARRIRRGEIQFGLCTAEGVYQIYHGTGAWSQEGAYQDYRILFVYVPAPNIIVVRADAGIQTLADLDGKPFSPGIQGSSGEATTRRMFEALGITPQWLPGSIDEAVNYIKDGQIVGFAKAASGPTIPDATYLDVSTFLDVKVLGLTEDQLATLAAKLPDLIPVEVPAGVYPGQDEPMRLPGVIGCYCAAKDFDDELAYAITKAVHENKDLQDEAFPAVKDLDYAELTMRYATIPLHSGAIRYYREIGAEIPERLLPPEAN